MQDHEAEAMRKEMKIDHRVLGVFLGILLLLGQVMPETVSAQSRDRLPAPLTLLEAIEYALEHYPAVRESLAKQKEAKSTVDLMETAYLPRVNIGYQATRSTFNNVSGTFFPFGFFKPISGSDLDRVSFGSAFGSAAGILLAWEPFDFGLRSANVGTAQTMERHSQAFITLTQLEVALAVGDAYIDVIMAQESRQAMQANLERRQVFATMVDALVENQLRAGVDGSRAHAEIAMARTQLLEVEQMEISSMANLTTLLAEAGAHLTIKDAGLRALPKTSIQARGDATRHPLAMVQKVAAEIPQKREEALARAWVPKFTLQSALFARGSGFDRMGDRTGPEIEGLLPDVPNWSVGLTATFALLDFPAIRAQKQQEHYRGLAEMARYDRVIQEITAQQVQTREVLENVRRIAENTPIQLDAARLTETQAAAQYKAGLATVVDVAEAQRLVVQAAVDDARARLGVWKTLLAYSGAHGDLSPFLQLIGSGS